MGFLKKLFDQVNPFDGGKTWKNPTPAPAPRPQPAQTPAPQNMNFAGSLSYGKPNAIGPAQTPSKATKVLKPVVPQVDIKNRYAQINSPSYGSGLSGILNKAKDVVDANTPQDQFKRNQTLSPVAPPNQTYQQQQATNPSNLTKASNFTSSVARTVGAPMVANVDLARAGVAQVTGNQTARNNALNSAKNNTLKIPNIAKDLAVGTIESSKQVGRGLANASGTTNNAQNAQSLLNDQLAQQRITAINRAKQGFNSQQDINRFTNYADNLWGNSAESTQTQVEAQKEIQKQVDPIRNALAIADVGLTATSFGVAGATKAGASKVTANALEQNLAKNMAKDSALKAAQTAGRNEIIRQSGLTGSMGAFQGAISPYIVKDPGTVTTKDVLGGGATGAILGGVLPGAFVGASKFADPISKATNNVFKNSLNQGGYVQAGPTPKNIHFEDHGTMGDTIDMVNGKYNPTAQERYNLELAASRVSERYGITPIGNNKDPLVNLANGFQKRLDLDQANKVGMFAESGSPVSLNQQGSIPNPLQAFDKLKNKLNGSALDTTVKPATPENVYGVNALEKLGKKLKMNQGGFLRVPGKDTEMMVTHNLSSENLNKARELGGIPQASVGIVDPKKYAIDGYGEITLVGNNKLVDPKTRGTRSYASDIYSPRQPKADYKMPQGMSDSLVKERYKDYFARYGDQRVRYMGGDNIVGNLSSEPAVIANFLDTKGIKHNIKLNNKDALYELRNVLSKNDSLNNEFYESFVPKEAMAMGAKPKLYAGTSNTTGRQKWVDESMENALKIMRKERKTGAEGIFSNYIGGIRATNTKKFNSIQEIVDNKNRLKTTADFEKAKEAIGTHHESLIDELGKYSDSTESNTFTQYDRQATAISDYLKGEKDAFDYGFKNVPPSFIAKLDTFKKQLHDMPTEYFESVSDRAVKLNEFEKALIPDNLSKPQREAIVKSLNEQGIQPRFYKDGQRQQALIDLMEEDNLARQAQNPVGKSQGGYIKLPGKGAPIERTNPVVQDYADMLKSIDDGAKGGQMVGNYSDGYKRITEHSKFYSDFYAQNKKKPTKADWVNEAQRQLDSGDADQDFLKAYQDSKNPEINSLLSTEQDALGKPGGGQTFEVPISKVTGKPSALLSGTKAVSKVTGKPSELLKQDSTLSPKNQVVSTEPLQTQSQKSQPLSQGAQTGTAKLAVDNTSAPIIPTESVKNPEAFIPEAKLASQGKPPKQATAKLLDSAKKSDVIPEDMVQAIDPTRSVKTNKETWTKAGQKLHELGDDGALNYFHENHGADSNAVAWRLYEKRLARGDNKGAQELLADMTTRSIENGQAAQAWAMIKRLDPKYITQKLDRQVDTFKKSDKYSDRIKKRIDWSADKQARISKYATDMSNDSTLDNLARTNNKDEIAQITGIQDEGIIKGLSKTNDPERIKMLLTTNFNKEINSILPSGFGDKAVAYWKSGLLSAPVTHVRNIVGNTTNSAFNTVETPIAGLLDSTFGRALTPTKRTVSANPLIGQGKGYKQGGQDFADALRYGITKDDAGKFDYKSINWNKNNPVEQHIFKPFTDAIFRTLGAEDKIFKQPGVMHSLYNQADAAAISAGKRGDAKWMANWVENAPAIVKEQAKKEGGAWVFQKDTVVSTAMRGLKNAVKREHPGFEKVIDGIQPFVNVPAAIGSELLTYTPAGLLRVGNKARKALNKNIDMSTRDIYRREAMKDLSKTTVGGGLIAAGLAMGYSGDASGTMPPKNTKEYDVWMQENRQANSIRIGNKWFNINSIGPQASLFNAAAQTGAWMKRNEGKGKTNDPLTSAVAFGGNVATNWFNSSSLTGASNAQKAISDPVRYGQDYAARQLTSFIPNAAKRLGAGVDPNMREGDSFKDAVLAQIPFARTNAPVKTDSTGTPVVNNAYGAMGMKSLFDPFNISTAKDGGNSVVNKTANKSGMAVQDLKEAKAITKSGYGKEWAKLSEDEIKNKAIEGDQQAQQVYDSLKAMEKVYAPKNVPTKGLSQSAEDILNKSKKFTESGQKAWGSKPSDSNDAKTSLKNWMNGKDVPVTNEIAVEWAKYEQKRVKGELSPLEQNEAKTTLLRKAYSSSLNEDERKYYSVADDKLIGAVQKGWVSQDSINKALAVDKQLLELGLTTKSGFGKKVWNALGLSMPSVAGASSSTRSTGRRSGGRVAKKSLKVTKSKIPQAFLSTSKLKSRRSSTNGSLRKLLSSAKV